MELSDKLPYLIHGIISSDSDSDSSGKLELDEEYHSLKPPPYDYESIKHKIKKIPAKKPPPLINIWETRIQQMMNNNNNDKQTEEVGEVKKVKKKKKKKTKLKAAQQAQESVILPCMLEDMVKKKDVPSYDSNEEKVMSDVQENLYKPLFNVIETSNKIQKNLDELNLPNVLHAGRSKIIQDTTKRANSVEVIRNAIQMNEFGIIKENKKKKKTKAIKICSNNLENIQCEVKTNIISKQEVELISSIGKNVPIETNISEVRDSTEKSNSKVMTNSEENSEEHNSTETIEFVTDIKKKRKKKKKKTKEPTLETSTSYFINDIIVTQEEYNKYEKMWTNVYAGCSDERLQGKTKLPGTLSKFYESPQDYKKIEQMLQRSYVIEEIRDVIPGNNFGVVNENRKRKRETESKGTHPSKQENGQYKIETEVSNIQVVRPNVNVEGVYNISGNASIGSNTCKTNVEENKKREKSEPEENSKGIEDQRFTSLSNKLDDKISHNCEVNNIDKSDPTETVKLIKETKLKRKKKKKGISNLVQTEDRNLKIDANTSGVIVVENNSMVDQNKSNQMESNVFGEEFGYFLRNMDIDGSPDVVSFLTNFKYEQIHRAFIAHQEKTNNKKANSHKGNNTANKGKLYKNQQKLELEPNKFGKNDELLHRFEYLNSDVRCHNDYDEDFFQYFRDNCYIPFDEEAVEVPKGTIGHDKSSIKQTSEEIIRGSYDYDEILVHQDCIDFPQKYHDMTNIKGNKSAEKKENLDLATKFYDNLGYLNNDNIGKNRITSQEILKEDVRCYYYDYTGKNFHSYMNFRENYLYMSLDNVSEWGKNTQLTIRKEIAGNENIMRPTKCDITDNYSDRTYNNLQGNIQDVFGETFGDILQNMNINGSPDVVSFLSNFKYERIHHAFTAYREKTNDKKANLHKGNNTASKGILYNNQQKLESEPNKFGENYELHRFGYLDSDVRCHNKYDEDFFQHFRDNYYIPFDEAVEVPKGTIRNDKSIPQQTSEDIVRDSYDYNEKLVHQHCIDFPKRYHDMTNDKGNKQDQRKENHDLTTKLYDNLGYLNNDNIAKNHVTSQEILKEYIRCYYYDYTGEHFQSYMDFRENYLSMSLENVAEWERNTQLTIREEIAKNENIMRLTKCDITENYSDRTYNNLQDNVLENKYKCVDNMSIENREIYQESLTDDVRKDFQPYIEFRENYICVPLDNIPERKKQSRSRRKVVTGHENVSDVANCDIKENCPDKTYNNFQDSILKNKYKSDDGYFALLLKLIHVVFLLILAYFTKIVIKHIGLWLFDQCLRMCLFLFFVFLLRFEKLI